MDIAAFVVSLIAVAIAALSLRVAIRREHRESNEAAARRRGQPVVVPRGGAGGPTANPIRHDYEVRNGGQATITALWLWIEDGEGNAVSTRAGGVLALAPGDAPAHMAVEVRQPLPEGELRLIAEWRDRDGTHEEWTGINPPRHH